jgi:hypothetical protein
MSYPPQNRPSTHSAGSLHSRPSDGANGPALRTIDRPSPPKPSLVAPAMIAATDADPRP